MCRMFYQNDIDRMSRATSRPHDNVYLIFDSWFSRFALVHHLDEVVYIERQILFVTAFIQDLNKDFAHSALLE